MFRMLAISHIEGEEKLFADLAPLITVDSLALDRFQLLEKIGEYDGYLCPISIRTDREVLDRAVRLKAIFTSTTGLDHIDLAYAREKGIAVFGMKNDRAFLDSVTATAEQSLALLLGVVRRIPWAFDAVKEGIWDRESYKGHQLSGKTLGIYGYGRLGTIMAQYGKALRMRVLAYDVQPNGDPAVEWTDRETLLKESDVLSIHIHLNDRTRGMFDEAFFAECKRGMILINTSRGDLVQEEALLKALESGQLAGAGLDVIHGEWSDVSQSPVVQYAKSHDNLLISPHVGGACYEAQLAALKNTLDKAIDFFANGCNEIATPTLIRSLMNGR